jgi:MarR family transcriptional regulator for hemolysin
MSIHLISIVLNPKHGYNSRMNRRPTGQPIGIALSNTAREVNRAFEEDLAAAGGSRSTWLVLMSLKNSPLSNQRQLAEAVGIQEATLTHHLNAMERDGLITRRRDPRNRRVHIVELTDGGEAAFHSMLQVVIHFDRKLRGGLTEDQVEQLRGLLGELQRNVSGSAPEWEILAVAPKPEIVN